LKRELQDELSEIVEKKQLIAIMVTHDWFETIKLANSINICSSKPLRLMSRMDVTESREHRKYLKISEFSEYAKYLNEIDGLMS
jgi:ABC-type nitrate/sulfonate/bicarbonate transport system ATPase subunit